MKKKQENKKELMEIFKFTMDDHLLRLNTDLIDLEKHPTSEQREELYRRMLGEYHSIKGSAGTVGQTNVVDLTHELEDLLEMMRQGSLDGIVELFDLHYESLDAISLMIRCRLNGELFPENVFKDLRQRIEQAKLAVMPKIRAWKTSVHHPNEGMNKRYILRKGNRHG